MKKFNEDIIMDIIMDFIINNIINNIMRVVTRGVTSGNEGNNGWRRGITRGNRYYNIYYNNYLFQNSILARSTQRNNDRVILALKLFDLAQILFFADFSTQILTDNRRPVLNHTIGNAACLRYKHASTLGAATPLEESTTLEQNSVSIAQN